jgi:hypothetical protein
MEHARSHGDRMFGRGRLTSHHDDLGLTASIRYTAQHGVGNAPEPICKHHPIFDRSAEWTCSVVGLGVVEGDDTPRDEIAALDEQPDITASCH